jgi:hypothetical protein
MKAALEKSPVEIFPELPTNDADKPILRGTVGGSVKLNINKETGRIATSSTPPELIIQKTYMPAHSILYYVNKEDPRGPAPSNPADDPQFQIWENAISDWIKRVKEKNPDWSIDFSEPPTQYDTPEAMALIPKLEILSPTPNAILTGQQLIVTINASAPRGITKATHTIDDRFVNVITTPPFGFNFDTGVLEKGWHSVAIKVEDDAGNAMEKKLNFFLDK